MIEKNNIIVLEWVIKLMSRLHHIKPSKMKVDGSSKIIKKQIFEKFLNFEKKNHVKNCKRVP